MGTMASKITSLTIVYSTVYSGADLGKHQSSAGTGEFPAQMASNAENAYIWWRHHGSQIFSRFSPIKFIRRLFRYNIENGSLMTGFGAYTSLVELTHYGRGMPHDVRDVDLFHPPDRHTRTKFSNGLA